MEISALLSLSIYHSTSNRRNASYDECFFDEVHHQKSFHRARSHKSNFVLARKLKDRSLHLHRNFDSAADVQLNRSSNHHQISVCFYNNRLFPALVRMLGVDCHFLLDNKVHRHKLNWAMVIQAVRLSNHHLRSGLLDRFRSSRTGSAKEILRHCESGSVLDMHCRLFRNRLFPCNSMLSHLFVFALLICNILCFSSSMQQWI